MRAPFSFGEGDAYGKATASRGTAGPLAGYPGAGPRRLRPCPCWRPSVVTEGYRGSRPLPPTPPAKTGEPGANLGPTWGEPGANLGRTLRSMRFRRFLRYLCCCLHFFRLLAFLLASWANIASSRANIAPRWLNLAPKMGQHSPKTGQDGPKMGQHSPKMDQHSLKAGPT